MAVKRLFLSVGAMKAGTTFLFNALSRHPDIYFTVLTDSCDGISGTSSTPITSAADSRR